MQDTNKYYLSNIERIHSIQYLTVLCIPSEISNTVSRKLSQQWNNGGRILRNSALEISDTYWLYFNVHCTVGIICVRLNNCKSSICVRERTTAIGLWWNISAGLNTHNSARSGSFLGQWTTTNGFDCWKIPCILFVFPPTKWLQPSGRCECFYTYLLAGKHVRFFFFAWTSVRNDRDAEKVWYPWRYFVFALGVRWTLTL